MPSENSEAFDPLRLLNDLRDIDYLLVDGFAAALYGCPLVTGDVDILPSADSANLDRLAIVLERLHAVVREPRGTGRRVVVTKELLEATARAEQGGQLRTRTIAGPLDIIFRLHDGRRYNDLVTGSELLQEDDLSVRVVGIDDLIEIKRTARRDRDALALPYLEEIRRRR